MVYFGFPNQALAQTDKLWQLRPARLQPVVIFFNGLQRICFQCAAFCGFWRLVAIRQGHPHWNIEWLCIIWHGKGWFGLNDAWSATENMWRFWNFRRSMTSDSIGKTCNDQVHLTITAFSKNEMIDDSQDERKSFD